jgi:hypothetical protein
LLALVSVNDLVNRHLNLRAKARVSRGSIGTAEAVPFPTRNLS